MGGVDRAVWSCDSGWLCSVGRREKRGSGLGARQGLSSLYPRHRAGAQEMGCQAIGQQSERQRRRGNSASLGLDMVEWGGGYGGRVRSTGLAASSLLDIF